MEACVFLIGFMGAGKSTLGRRLAAKLSLRFIDLDQEVADAGGFSALHELIETKGMASFRALESEVLKQLNTNGAVIATGGGTPCYADNLSWMKRKGPVVFIDLDPGMLFSRLKQGDLSKRPLLAGKDTEALRSYIEETLAERLPFYRQAHLTYHPVVDEFDDLCAELSRMLDQTK